MRDLVDNLKSVQSLPPAARAATATGSTIDLQGYNSCMIEVNFGARTDGTHTPSLTESSDGTTFTAVAAASLNGSFAAIAANSGSNSVQKVGYAGNLRYLQPIMTIANGTTGMLSAISGLLGRASFAPVS